MTLWRSSVSCVRRTLIPISFLAAVFAAPPAFAAPPTDAPPNHDAMQKRLAACATCHGKQGQGDLGTGGGVYPRLAGQPIGYLYGQLLRFKSARRTGIPPVTTMHRLLATLPEPYLRLIAAYYRDATAPFPPPTAKQDARWREGRDLVQHGLPQAGIAACTSCHGATLDGRPPDVPALAGQYARYLTIQFAHWAQGARQNPVHEHIAHALTSAQIEAMSHYLASLRSAAAKTEAAQP